MTATQAALGDRETPVPTTPDTVPAGCWWFTDPDGDLCLLPGCMARVNDPEAECTCDNLGARLAKAQEQVRDLREEQRYARTWIDALRAAVDAHPDRAAILADAYRMAGR